MAALVEELNKKYKEQERQRKDERKRRREEAVMPDSAWLCGIGGCAFSALSKACEPSETET